MYDDPIFITKFGIMSQPIGGCSQIEDIEKLSAKKN